MWCNQIFSKNIIYFCILVVFLFIMSEAQTYHILNLNLNPNLLSIKLTSITVVNKMVYHPFCRIFHHSTKGTKVPQ